MKTIIALCIIGYAFAAQGNPLATSYCMSITDATAAVCTGCYNYGTGTLKAKWKNATTNLCTSDLTAITDCLWYDSGKTSDTRAVGDCGQCNGKDWMNIAAAAGSTWTVACSATVPTALATACDAKVPNCAQSYCYSATTGANYVKGCRLCDVGYHIGAETAVGTIGAATCLIANSGNTQVANCSVYLPTDKTKCVMCAAGYAVADANDTSCVAFTVDTNCRKAGGTSNTYCNGCKNGYYFSSQVCTIGYSTTTATVTGANLMAASALFMALLAFFN